MMHPARTYLIVLSAVLFSGAHAQASDEGANLILLAPGKSVTFTDAANPGINVAVTAPGDAYLNLSRLIAASEKAGIYSVITTVQIKAAGRIVTNADGSLSLQPAADESYFVPRDARPGPGRITLGGGTAVFDRGRIVVHSDSIVQPAPVSVRAPVPPAAVTTGAPGAIPLNSMTATKPAVASTVFSGSTAPIQTVSGPTITGLPTGGTPVSGSGGANLQIDPAPRLISNWSSFNVGTGSSMTITQPSGSVTLNNVSSSNGQVFGTLSATGGTFNIVPSSGVTVTPSVGGVTLTGVPGSNMNISGNLSGTGNIVINNPGGTITVAPGTVMPSGNITINTAPVTTGGNITVNTASQGSVRGVISVGGSATPPVTPVIAPR